MHVAISFIIIICRHDFGIRIKSFYFCRGIRSVGGGGSGGGGEKFDNLQTHSNKLNVWNVWGAVKRRHNERYCTNRTPRISNKNFEHSGRRRSCFFVPSWSFVARWTGRQRHGFAEAENAYLIPFLFAGHFFAEKRWGLVSSHQLRRHHITMTRQRKVLTTNSKTIAKNLIWLRDVSSRDSIEHIFRDISLVLPLRICNHFRLCLRSPGLSIWIGNKSRAI